MTDFNVFSPQLLAAPLFFSVCLIRALWKFFSSCGGDSFDETVNKQRSLVDISPSLLLSFALPLLFCPDRCPLPSLTRLQYTTPKIVYPSLFFFSLFPHLTPSPIPPLPFAFVIDGPSSTPPSLSLCLSLSPLMHCLSHFLIMCSSIQLGGC